MGKVSPFHWRMAVVALCVFGCFMDCIVAEFNHEEHGEGGDEIGEELKRDAAALLAFQRGIVSDPTGALQKWGVNENPCLWPGVGCGKISSDATRVVSLELRSTKFEGSISGQLGKLSALRSLTVVDNQLSGSIPRELTACHSLVTLDLRNNGLSGLLPFGLLTRLKSLRTVLLSGNQLSGSLDTLFHFPRKLGNGQEGVQIHPMGGLCKELQVLDLAHNLITGQISQRLGACAMLSKLYLSGNHLVGSIPVHLGKLRDLQSLALDDNLLEGFLPQELAHCTRLQFLDFSDNLFSGSIPSSWAELQSLQDLRVSNNRLSGPIPQGKWIQEGPRVTAFLGNSGLCGRPLQACRGVPAPLFSQLSRMSLPRVMPKIAKYFQRWIPSEQIRQSPSPSLVRTRRVMTDTSNSYTTAAAPAPAVQAAPSHHSKNNHTGRKWGVGIALGAVAGALAAILFALTLRICIYLVRTRTPYLKGPVIFNTHITPKMLSFLDKEGSLTTAEEIGAGGTGKVYKVHLENGMVVAIKSILVQLAAEKQSGTESSHSFSHRQIQAELETLGCIKHRNLVRLLAYIHKPEVHLLMYEFMPNGSLESALHKMISGELDMPWPMRYRIAVGVAQGMSYLHHDSVPKIVHRDLKPGNILLDADFEAHLADFGLAKVIPETQTHVTTSVAGTVGYIAPEYHQTCRFTEKSDVYSFGVVLAVLLTGRLPTSQFFVEAAGGSIGHWLQSLMQSGKALGALDPKLRGSESEEKEMLLAMKIAVFCTDDLPTERPFSKEVLRMLLQIPDSQESISSIQVLRHNI